MSEFSDVAHSAAHMLNNTAVSLMGATSDLGDMNDAISRADIGRRINKSCTDVRALSAALTLLALDRQDIESVLSRDASILDEAELAKLGRVLMATYSVAFQPATSVTLPVRCRIDPHTLQMVLICAAAALSYASAGRAHLACAVTNSGTQITFALSHTDTQTGTSSPQVLPVRYPCTKALRHASVMLKAWGVSIAANSARAIDVTIDVQRSPS
jgi:hypothetical protein